MSPADLPAVHALQCRAYPPAYHESQEVLGSRLNQGGARFCLVADSPAGLLAYLFAHPWQGAPPALHAPLPHASAADHVFLHDLAVCPSGRGQALAEGLLSRLLLQAREQGFSELRLVALRSAHAFWLRMGWSPLDMPSLDAAYGDAQQMSRLL